jgi:hypothetical protein
LGPPLKIETPDRALADPGLVFASLTVKAFLTTMALLSKNYP